MATGSTQPFKPAFTASIAVTETSADVAIPGNGQTALIYNSTTSMVFVAFGKGAATALPAIRMRALPFPPDSAMRSP
jgi:hypothetical protein